MLRVRRQGLLEIREMLSLVDAAVAHNVDRKKAVGKVGDDPIDDNGLVDGGPHRDRIVSWDENEIPKGGGAYVVALHKVIERNIALKKKEKKLKSAFNSKPKFACSMVQLTIAMVITLGLGM